MMQKPTFFWVFLFFGMSLMAQEGKVINHIYDGNEQASAELYNEAEMDYRRALSKAPENPEALYNLGNTHFQEQDFDEAKQRFFQTQKFTENKSSKHHAFHNLGNVFMKQKDYAKAVEAYKNALRNNPEDEETRYNYALAKELLEKEQDQQQNQDQNDQQDQKDQEDQQDQQDQDNKDENKEGDKDKDPAKEDEDKEGDEGEDGEDQKDKGDQEKQTQPEQGDSEKEQPSKPQQTELSPDQVKSLLEAMSNQEKKVQDKVNAEKVQGTPLRGQKDW